MWIWVHSHCIKRSQLLGITYPMFVLASCILQMFQYHCLRQICQLYNKIYYIVWYIYSMDRIEFERTMCGLDVGLNNLLQWNVDHWVWLSCIKCKLVTIRCSETSHFIYYLSIGRKESERNVRIQHRWFQVSTWWNVALRTIPHCIMCKLANMGC